MQTEHDQPNPARLIQDFKFKTASGYSITGSVEILFKTLVQPVPPRPLARCNAGDHWQAVRINAEDVMILRYDVDGP